MNCRILACVAIVAIVITSMDGVQGDPEPLGKDKQQVLIVVDMEKDYCTEEFCPYFQPTKGYSRVPAEWSGLKPDGEPKKSVPAENVVFEKISEIMNFRKSGEDKPYFDLIVFTHDWNNYGQVCMNGTKANYDLSPLECWEGSELAGGDLSASLVAWTPGTEIVQQLVDTVPFERGMNDPKVIHVVKKHANWGLAEFQDMGYNKTNPQGPLTPLKLQSMGYFPFNTRLTVTGSFTQYCVLGGVLQMILDGYDDIILPAASTGGYQDRLGPGTIIYPPWETSSDPEVIDITHWMKETSTVLAGAKTVDILSVNDVHALKSEALEWMDYIGVDVFYNWQNYISYMESQGAELSFPPPSED